MLKYEYFKSIAGLNNIVKLSYEYVLNIIELIEIDFI